jgi:SAM-dependent methyltransferase
MARGLLSHKSLGLVRQAARKLRALPDPWLRPHSASAAEHWQRRVLNRSVDAYLERLGPSERSAAEISGASHAGMPWRSFVSLDYPAFDLCAPPAEHDTYDVVICEQVLEHVLNPVAAAETLQALARPGGHVIVSTPFLIRVHELPAYGMPDLWRFTPRGLRVLLEGAGLEVGEVQAWGNRDCVVANFDHWAAYRRWHSLRNEPELPVQVWAFARRPGQAGAGSDTSSP